MSCQKRTISRTDKCTLTNQQRGKSDHMTHYRVKIPVRLGGVISGALYDHRWDDLRLSIKNALHHPVARKPDALGKGEGPRPTPNFTQFLLQHRLPLKTKYGKNLTTLNVQSSFIPWTAGNVSLVQWKQTYGLCFIVAMEMQIQCQHQALQYPF